MVAGHSCIYSLVSCWFIKFRTREAEIQRDFVIGFAAELTEMVGIQVIDQLQASIGRGDVTNWLFHPETRQPYVQVNGRNEVKAIAKPLVNVSVYDVLP